jgi:hypothetical protein
VQNLVEQIVDSCDVEVLVCHPRDSMPREVANGVNVTRAGLSIRTRSCRS